MEEKNKGYNNLREWIAVMREKGQIMDVNGADWRNEVGAINEIMQKKPESPAVLYDNICDYPAGYRILGNPLNSVSRLAYTAGIKEPENKLALSRELSSRINNIELLPPREVATGPIFENTHRGDEIDLFEFPVPKWHPEDAGRYIGTGCNFITSNYDGSWVNLGTYRVMVINNRQASVHFVTGHHGWRHMKEYHVKNERFPVVLVVGGDPLLFMASCNDVPVGVSELAWAGGLRGRPFDVVRGPITGLPIPAEAEIAIEGFIEPNKLIKEGPFGEWTGYYGSQTMSPVIDVQAIHHRNNPILLGCPHSKPPDETAFFKAVFRSALLEDSLRRSGIPEIQGCWAHEIGGGRMLLVVSIKQQYAGHASQAGHVAASCQIGALLGRYVVVVDEDIDVTNLQDVIWALLTRSDPATSVDIIKRAWGSPLDPRMAPEDKKSGHHASSRAIIEATKPFEWKESYPRTVHNWPIRDQIKDKWEFLKKYI